MLSCVYWLHRAPDLIFGMEVPGPRLAVSNLKKLSPAIHDELYQTSYTWILVVFRSIASLHGGENNSPCDSSMVDLHCQKVGVTLIGARLHSIKSTVDTRNSACSLSHRSGNITIATHACRALYNGVNRWPYTHLKMFMGWLCGCSTNVQ